MSWNKNVGKSREEWREHCTSVCNKSMTTQDCIYCETPIETFQVKNDSAEQVQLFELAYSLEEQCYE